MASLLSARDDHRNPAPTSRPDATDELTSRRRDEKSFEIIAGRVLAEDGSQRSVGFVRSIDKHSRTRVQRAIAELGGASDGLMVFTDGDTKLRDLQMTFTRLFRLYFPSSLTSTTSRPTPGTTRSECRLKFC